MSDMELFDALSKYDFYSYLQRVFYEINGGEKFVPNWHIEVLCYHLEQVRFGKTKRLIINVPPRSLKSIIVNIAFTTWVLGHNPKEKIVSISYASDLSDKFARDSKIVMESNWYKKLFPQSSISKSRSSAADFNTVSRGGRYSTSIEGTLTGLGGNLIIIDDPIKPNEASSEHALNKVNDWYKATLSSRFNDPENGVLILIMQRVHENDLTGHLLESNPDVWTHIKIPQIATHDEIWDIESKIFQRKTGNILDKNRMSNELVESKKQEVGTYVWESQYQQDPCPSEGGIIKEHWLQYYDLEKIRGVSMDRIHGIYLSWDTASKVGENNAYSACCTIAKIWMSNTYKYYLLDVIRGKWEMPELVTKAKELYNIWRSGRTYPVKILIEDMSSGIQLAQILKQEIDDSGWPLNVKPIKPEGDKKTRMYGASVYIERGELLFPNHNPYWWIDFKKELLGFPGSKFKDQCDALSQGINCAAREPYHKFLEPSPQ